MPSQTLSADAWIFSCTLPHAHSCFQLTRSHADPLLAAVLWLVLAFVIMCASSHRGLLRGAHPFGVTNLRIHRCTDSDHGSLTNSATRECVRVRGTDVPLYLMLSLAGLHLNLAMADMPLAG